MGKLSDFDIKAVEEAEEFEAEVWSLLEKGDLRSLTSLLNSEHEELTDEKGD